MTQATLQGRSETSKCSTLRAPLWPLMSRCHVASTPQASGVTIPIPVMTTRFISRLRRGNDGAYAPRHRAKCRRATISLRSRGCPRSAFCVLLEKLDRVAHGQNGLGCIVGNLAAEFFFKGHHELDGVEA